MLGKPGPFQVIKSEEAGSPECPSLAPRRRYECQNYQSCLNIAAALNWDSFTCRGCCGEIQEGLFWRAHQAQRTDKVAETICELPPIKCLEREPGCNPGKPSPLKLAR